ncbi:MAG: DUF1365 domain-containing protein [Geminicoccaceae bacterium]|nr:DUF1365 domain-containing protein [Geminicoccaceae bacterium]
MSATNDAMPRAGLYVGEVMHHRLRPFRHRFVYRIFTLLLDLDRLEGGENRLVLLGIERPAVLSFRRRDHGARDGSQLRPWVEQELRRAGIDWRPAQILLLALPRLFGYVFNPLSIYYCYRPDGRLGAVLHEVKNTFGGQRAYALAVDEHRLERAPVRQACAKDFYVSPFIEMDAAYRFKLSEPGDRLTVVIQEDVAAGPQLVASMTLRRRPLSDRALLAALRRIPLLTFKVILGIHFEAFRLWLKGARLQPRPVDPADLAAGRPTS